MPAGEPAASSAIKPFGSPFAAALLFTLTVLTSPVSREIPIAVGELYQILACVPMILLMRPGRWRMDGARTLLAQLFLFAVDTVRSAVAAAAPIDQVILLSGIPPGNRRRRVVAR